MKVVRNLLIIAGIILFLVFCLPLIIGKVKEIRAEKEAESYYTPELVRPITPEQEAKEEAEYRQRLSAEASDIDGWTKLDKYDAGLYVRDGSDTDGDSLTDKEEIEVYKSDPKKRSTADDLYLDGYKVEHGMDLFTYYDYEGEIEFVNNTCPEVQLKTVDNINMYAYVYQRPASEYSTDGLDVYRAYQIDNYYDGDVSIDVSEILDEKNTRISDIAVYTCAWYGGNLTQQDFTAEGNVISLTNKINDDIMVLITKKPNFFDSIKLKSIDGVFYAGEDTANNAKGSAINVEQMKALVVDIPILFFTCQKPFMYYVSTGDEAADHLMLQKMVEATNVQMAGFVTVEESDFVEISEGKMEMKELRLSALPERCHRSPYSDDDSFILFQYFNAEDIWNDAKVNTDTDINAKSDRRFTEKDMLPFGNFGSYISPEGNCSGIAEVTSLVYNTGTLPGSGSYDTSRHGDNGMISWDLAAYDENETFFNRGLSDYKDKNFVKDREDASGNIIAKTDGEQAFIDMIGCYWAEANDARQDSDYERSNLEGQNYSFELIELMKQYLDNGKILNADFRTVHNAGSQEESYGGHTVNIVGYQQHIPAIDEDLGAEMYDFKMYDNNFPGRFFNLVVTRKTSETDHPDTFSYYCDNGYSVFTSNDIDKYKMVVSDENYNTLNDMVD